MVSTSERSVRLQTTLASGKLSPIEKQNGRE
jgi:hypothetical protein